MDQNKLFNLTRWRLAVWYAGVMGVILSLSGWIIYRVMIHSEWQALHQQLESVAGTLHDTLEPKLKQPGKLEAVVKDSLPGLCLTGERCIHQSLIAERHILGVVQQNSYYYLRFLNLSGRIIGRLGQQPQADNTQLSTITWQTLHQPLRNLI